MADYPTRQFTDQDAWSVYQDAIGKDQRKKDIAAKIHQMYMLTNPRYRGSSAATYNQKYVKGLGTGTSTGLSTRLRLMGDADKEMVAKQFTTGFQDWHRENPNGTLKKFNIWADEQGPWYSIELRKQHAAAVVQQEKETSRIAGEEREIQTYEAGQLKEEEKDAVQAAANILSGKYADSYRSKGAGEQSDIFNLLQEEINGSEFPQELRGVLLTETLKILKEAYGFKGDVKAEILAAEDKALQKSRAERKWNLGDRHPDQWWADTHAAKVFRDLMEKTKDIETDFERAQKIQELKREALVESTFMAAGINEDELDSLLASAGFPAQPFTSTQYNQLMERKQLIAGGRFEDAFQMYNREFSQDPAFSDWQSNAREAGIYKIMSSLVPDWPENSRNLVTEWERFRDAELLDEDGNEIAKAERDKKTLSKLDELASKYKVSPRFIYWALTKGRKEVWGIGATVLVDI
jgi:hypothetical protein